MNDSQPIISVEEARKILGTDAAGLADDEILNIINTLDLVAKDALEEARRKVRMKKDAKELAEVVYSVYKDKKHLRKPKP